MLLVLVAFGLGVVVGVTVLLTWAMISAAHHNALEDDIRNQQYEWGMRRR